MKTTLALVFAGLTTFAVATPHAQAQSIADIVAMSGDGSFDNDYYDYDLLLNAVITADLVGALDDPSADLTVFAPNDAAFVRLARDLGYSAYDEAGAWSFLVQQLTTLGGGDPVPVLTSILLYHVAPQSLSPIEIFIYSIFGIPISTLQGVDITPFFFFLIDQDPDLRNPILTLPIDVQADNGVIHTIHRVLLPIDL